ncbi:hypothetical protein [uncultured Microbacterium sp.]|uniref:hypothetical protein n=1 Tax=uncultured Microbacterium sp. TaxID=191216 RepID=UPI0035CAB980
MSLFHKPGARVAFGAVAGLAALGLVIGGGTLAASAANDPGSNSRPNYVAVGSDTLQDLYGAFASSTTPNYHIDSYTAFASENITVDGVSISRPAGSGDGVKALSASLNPASNKFNSATHSVLGDQYLRQGADAPVQIARSSSRPASGFTFATGDLAYIPLGRDAVSVAIRNVPGVTNLTTAQLFAIYSSGSYDNAPTGLSDGDVQLSSGVVQLRVAGAWVSLTPKLPQSASGTRAFFLSATGVSTIGAWVTQGATIAENDGAQLTATGQLIPFSAAQWVAQWNNVATRTFTPFSSPINLISINSSAAYNLTGGAGTPANPGTASAGALYGSGSTAPTPGVGTFARDVYSVVGKASVRGNNATTHAFEANATATPLATLVTTTLPAASQVAQYGFLPLSYSATTANWLYGPYTNPAL